jgi:hypothetical protein
MVVDKGSTPLLAIEDPFIDQFQQSLANGGSADFKLLAELILSWYAITWSEFPVSDLLFDDLFQLAIDRQGGLSIDAPFRISHENTFLQGLD